MDAGTIVIFIWSILETLKNLIISQFGVIAVIFFFIGLFAAKLIGTLKGFLITIFIFAIIIILITGIYLAVTGTSPSDMVGAVSGVPSALGDMFNGNGGGLPAGNVSNISGGAG